ncbi:MAG TPA: 3-hydroxyacyl-CoA dehydrogenase NAD-binding domain-containing protein [Anaeromyxobacteraceae bacterium]|nr:3-hydroxyacyl-CoA dehydrogenase NAD-binding domain-containing protein [Anaeromyxobacteraceae bacterium]
MLAIETVAVLGTGDVAHTCAILASLAGCAVRFHHPAPDALDRAFEAIRFRVDLAIERGQLTRADRQRILDGILFTPDLEEAVTSADLVAGLEPGAASILAGAAGLIRATAALATPGIAPAAALADRVPQPGRVLALELDEGHGFTRLGFRAAPHTSGHTLAGAEAFAARVNARGSHEA